MIYSFRVHVDSDLFKWMEDYDGSISELVRDVVHAHAFETDRLRYQEFLSLQKRGETWHHAHKWLLNNMSEAHYNEMMEWVRSARDE